MTPKSKCFAYCEHVATHNKITPFCKVLNSTAEGQIPCAVAPCKLFKTYAEYNPKQVEAQIKEYGRTHE